MPRTTKGLLYIREEIGRRGYGEDWWELISAYI